MFKLATLHPYRKRTASQKCCFKILKPKSLIGSNVSQVHTPFSKPISSNLLGFIDRLFLNLSKLVCLLFFDNLFSYFDLSLVDYILFN